MLLKRSGVLFLDDEPKYMVDEIGDNMLAFYKIKEKTINDFKETKDLNTLSKDYIVHHRQYKAPKFDNAELNNFVKKHFSKDREKAGYSKVYALPIFTSNISEETDFITGNLLPCFEYKPNNKSTNIFISIHNIKWKDKADIDFDKVSELIYYNELMKPWIYMKNQKLKKKH